VDSGLIPTGELRDVAGTPMDLRSPVAIGARIDDDDEQLRFGHGYDHNLVLNKAGTELSIAARISEPTTGRVLEVLTTEPGVQFYTGNFLDRNLEGKGGAVYDHRCAFCLETQHSPDSPNRPEFPTTVLRPGEVYETTTVYRFRVDS
jgi:aldose 1-epimerase